MKEQTKTEEGMPKRSSDEVLQELREENTFNIPIRKKSGTKR